MSNIMQIDCQEWREVAAEFPVEMEVIIEMLIACDEELCYDEAA